MCIGRILVDHSMTSGKTLDASSFSSSRTVTDNSPPAKSSAKELKFEKEICRLDFLDSKEKVWLFIS